MTGLSSGEVAFVARQLLGPPPYCGMWLHVEEEKTDVGTFYSVRLTKTRHEYLWLHNLFILCVCGLMNLARSSAELAFSFL